MTRNRLGRGEFSPNFEQTFDSTVFVAQQKMTEVLELQQSAAGMQFVTYDLYNGRAVRHPLARMLLVDNYRLMHQNAAEILEVGLPVYEGGLSDPPFVVGSQGFAPYMVLTYHNRRSAHDGQSHVVTPITYDAVFTGEDPFVADIEQKLLTFEPTPWSLSQSRT